MAEIIERYYVWLSSLSNSLTYPISDLATAINIPVVSVLLFGLLGAVAPCQLSTNVAALAFLSRDLAHTRRLWARAVAFVAGKMTVYLLIGGMIVALGWQLNQLTPTMVPVAVVARRALGPLLIVVGLFLLGLVQPRVSIGSRVSAQLVEKFGQRRGVGPAYLLGTIFSFAFCPTLFWLFFGLTIPLSVATPGGIIFPGLFAVGTALPLLGLAALLAGGPIDTGRFVKRFKRADVWLQRVVGIVFILIGLNEAVVYWFI